MPDFVVIARAITALPVPVAGHLIVIPSARHLRGLATINATTVHQQHSTLTVSFIGGMLVTVAITQFRTDAPQGHRSQRLQY
jgi:hypothetical protein